MNFQGEYLNTIDSKGRSSIPARFREVLTSAYGDDTLKVTKKNGGLVAYPLSLWRRVEAAVEGMPAGQQKDDVYRTLIGPAQDCPFDKQGRVAIPLALRSYAGLDQEREIVIVGIANKIEIWNLTRHTEVTRQSEARLLDNPQLLADLGF